MHELYVIATVFGASAVGSAIICYPQVTLTRGWSGVAIYLLACAAGGPFIMTTALLASVLKGAQLAAEKLGKKASQ